MFCVDVHFYKKKKSFSRRIAPQLDCTDALLSPLVFPGLPLPYGRLLIDSLHFPLCGKWVGCLVAVGSCWEAVPHPANQPFSYGMYPSSSPWQETISTSCTSPSWPRGMQERAHLTDQVSCRIRWSILLWWQDSGALLLAQQPASPYIVLCQLGGAGSKGIPQRPRASAHLSFQLLWLLFAFSPPQPLRWVTGVTV